MSPSEIERFAADLNADSGLRAEAREMQADGSPGLPLDNVVSFATRKGYAITAEAVIAFAQAAQVQADAKRLTDAELDGVAGGGDDPVVMVPMQTFVQATAPVEYVRWECVTELVPVPVPMVSLFVEEANTPPDLSKNC